ncbi:hypothetical protein CP533_0215 [Ophiocordyceps camponoti-saundersi (nom. inval.)]|nr:hypothetical protein CP533_0215 [Ophiocordyceps camponoti-saundersi (nom. inval.)]
MITSSSGSEAEPTGVVMDRRRVATVFDAVEGMVDASIVHSNGNAAVKYSARNQPLTPDEVLFRRKTAPQRYEGYDIYRAHVDLPQGGLGALPDSDMLRAIHSYVRRFYKSLAPGKAPNVNERSMDETALLAFGILLEEAVGDVLGENGDLVFTERADADYEARKIANRRNLVLTSEDERRRKKSKKSKKEKKQKKQKKFAVTDDTNEVAQSSREQASMAPVRGTADTGTSGDEVAAGCHVKTERKSIKRRRSDEDDSAEEEVQRSVPRIQSTVGTVVTKKAKKRVKKKHAFC